MRPLIDIVSAMTLSIKSGRFAAVMARMPLSESARLMDFVKFKGVVEGSRKSVTCQGSTARETSFVLPGNDTVWIESWEIKAMKVTSSC
jgi:hypothetical protein